MKPTRLFAQDPEAAPLPGQLPAGGHGLEVRHEGGRHVADLLGHDVARLLRHRHQRGHRLVVAPLLLLRTDIGIRRPSQSLSRQSRATHLDKITVAATAKRLGQPLADGLRQSLPLLGGGVLGVGGAAVRLEHHLRKRGAVQAAVLFYA